MRLAPQSDTKLKVELATGKQTQSSTSVKNLNFKLGGHETSSSFMVLPLGIYDGILGMDWLIKNNATIDCKEKKLKFKSLNGKATIVTGTRGDPKLHLVPATKLLKAYRKKQMIYAVKLNPIDKPKLVNEPAWLSEYDDIFPKDLTDFPHHERLIMQLTSSQEHNQLQGDHTRCPYLKLLSSRSSSLS